MAAPVIQNKTGFDNTNTFTKPTGLADNDVVYIMYSAFSDATAFVDPTNIPAAPSGFTKVFMRLSAAASFNPLVACFRKIITSAAGEPASYTVTAAPLSGGGQYPAGTIYRISGADTTTPEDDSGSAIDANPMTTGAIIDSSGSEALLLLVGTSYDSVAGDTPTGMTQDALLDGAAQDIAMWSETISSPLSGATRTLNGTAPSATNALGFVVIKPAGGGGADLAIPELSTPHTLNVYRM